MIKRRDQVLYLGTLSASLMNLANGLALGWTSPVLPQLTAADSPIPLTKDEAALVVSTMAFGMVLSPLPAGLLAGVLGRRTILLSTAAPALLSWLTLLLARSAATLYVGRVLAGITIGAVLAVTPMYVGEIARDSNRGALGTVIHTASTIGTLIAYCVGPYVSYTVFALVCAAFPLLFLATFSWMPESPYFLLAKKRPHDAGVALARIRGAAGPESVQQELDMMTRSLEEKAILKCSFGDLFRVRGNRKALIIMIVLTSLAILSGHSFIMMFSGVIFTLSGSSIDANASSILLAVVQTVFNIVPSLLIEKSGRRPLLLVSLVGVVLTMLVEGLFFFLNSSEGVDMSSVDWIPLVGLILFLIFYSIGLGSLPIAMQGEIFHYSIKIKAMAVNGVVVSILYASVIEVYIKIGREFGLFVTFWISALCCASGAMFVAVYVPETKGKSLDEISHELNNSPGVVQEKPAPLD